MKSNATIRRMIKKCRPLYKLSVKIYWSIYKRIEVILWKMQGKPVPPPHLVKQSVVQKYAKKFRIRVFIETGTYHGAIVGAMGKINS